MIVKGRTIMKKSYTRIWCIILLTGLLILPFSYTSANDITNQNTSDGNDIQSLPKGVYIYQLDNGMQVLLIENTALPMVGVNVVVKVGSAYETFATSGMSHMLEHLLFNGTTTMKQKELYDATDKIGGYNNAHTSSYNTNYMMVTPAANIYEGMKIQAGMLFDSILPEEKFEKEKGIVMEEIAKSLANPSEQEERNILSIIYNGHALSLPTLGTYETIKNMVRDDVNDFYKNYYVPNNMIMSVIGNFSRSEMMSKIEEIYGRVKPGIINLAESRTWGTGFEQSKSELHIENKVFHRFYTGKQLSVNILYELQGAYTSEFLELLGLSLSIRADSVQKICDGKFPGAVSKISFQTRTYPIKNYLDAVLKFKDATNMKEIINLFKVELAKQSFGLPEDLFDAEAVKRKTDFIKNIEKPHMFGIYNADKLGEYGIESVFESYSVSGYKEAGKLLNDFSISNNPVIIIQHPFVEEESTESGAEISLQLFENGGKHPVVMAKQNSNSELLAVHYMIKNKAAYEEKYGTDAAFLWHDAFGQRMKSAENKKKSIDYGLTFTVNDNPYIPMDNIYLSPAFGYIRVEGLADDIAGAIDYLNNQMLDFIPTQSEFDNAVRKIHGTKMMKRENRAKVVFEKSYKDIIYEPEKYPPTGESVTYEKLLEFGREYFNPQNIIISIVSPASTDDINSYFSDFYNKENIKPLDEPAYKRKYVHVNESHTFVDSVGGEQSYLFYGYTKQIEKNDAPAVKALSLLLADKIIFDIREKQGMAYRMSAGVNVIEDIALFYINMGTRPENVDKLKPQFPGFFNKEYASSFTEDELTKRVNMYLGRMMFRRLSSINQAYYLGHSYYFDGDIYSDEDALNKLKEVRIEDVMRVTEKYLIVTNPVEVIVR
jgi:predicted Zn-dependent peptidase